MFADWLMLMCDLKGKVGLQALLVEISSLLVPELLFHRPPQSARQVQILKCAGNHLVNHSAVAFCVPPNSSTYFVCGCSEATSAHFIKPGPRRDSSAIEIYITMSNDAQSHVFAERMATIGKEPWHLDGS
jgi:hypothetical protein